MKTIHLFLAGLFGIVLFFTACEKEEEVTNPAVENIAEEMFIEEIFGDVFDEADEASVVNELKSTEGGLTGERNINRERHGDTLCLTVEYNNWRNAYCHNNRVKNGTIVMNMEGAPDSNQFRCTIQLQNFSVDGIQVKGTKEIEKQAENTYRIRIMNGELIFPDNTTCTRNCERIQVRTQGSETPAFIWDDVYEITGSAEGKNRANNMYTHEIKNALEKNMQWRYMVKGVVEITSGENQATLDFGNGEFDNSATLTMNGKVYTLNLER